MSGHLYVIPQQRDIQDVPASLRHLADAIERGEFGKVDALAWTIDSLDGVALGMIGGDHPGDAHLLFSVAAAIMVEAVMQQKPRL